MKETLIKIYFYVTSGQAVVDRFRYTYFIILSLYVVLKFTNYFYILLLLIVALPILFFFGWYDVHKISKVRERLSIEHGTHYAFEQFNIIKEIRDILKNK